MPVPTGCTGDSSLINAATWLTDTAAERCWLTVDNVQLHITTKTFCTFNVLQEIKPPRQNVIFRRAFAAAWWWQLGSKHGLQSICAQYSARITQCWLELLWIRLHCIQYPKCLEALLQSAHTDTVCCIHIVSVVCAELWTYDSMALYKLQCH